MVGAQAAATGPAATGAARLVETELERLVDTTAVARAQEGRGPVETVESPRALGPCAPCGCASNEQSPQIL